MCAPNARVTEVTAEGVKLADGSFIPSELVVWAAGVKGPDVLAKLDGLEVSRSNTLVVKPTLQTTRTTTSSPSAIARYLVPPGETAPIPPRAQAAHQEASHLDQATAARACGASRCSRSTIAISARWFRSANIRPSAT